MTYRIVHKTTYKYKHPVSYGTHVAYLTPRSKLHQTCTSHELLVTPAPTAMSERVDYFGNPVTFFTVQEPHEELNIEAHSQVFLDGLSASWPEHSAAWEDVARSVAEDLTEDGLDAYQFVFESPRIKPLPE